MTYSLETAISGYPKNIFRMTQTSCRYSKKKNTLLDMELGLQLTLVCHSESCMMLINLQYSITKHRDSYFIIEHN